MMDSLLIWPLIGGIIAIIFVVYLTLELGKKSRGNSAMIEISDSVQIGAKAFLKREYTYIFVFVVIIFPFLSIVGMVKQGVGLNYKTGIAFVIGAICSALAGYIGMSIATRANSRTTEAAREGGVKGALGIAISGGAVMGRSVVGISLIGLALVFSMFNGESTIINGYAMGASLVAAFARSGVGIYT